MKNYNYKYVVIPGKKVIALSTYAGRTVRGVAKCHPDDKFDEEFGKKLAAARCNQKIASKRYERAFRKYQFMSNIIKEAEAEFKKTCDYLRDAAAAEHDAFMSIAELRGSLTHDD